MRDHPASALNVSVGRLVGVVAGLSLGTFGVHWLGPSALTIGVVLTLALLGGLALRVGGAPNIQVAVSALLVFANSDPGAYAYARLFETTIGVAVTVVVALLLLPANPRAKYAAGLREVANDLAAHLAEAAVLVLAPELVDAALQRLREDCRTTEDLGRELPSRLDQALRATGLSPLRRHDREPLAAMAPAAALCAELARQERIFTDELADLAARPDVRSDWDTASIPLNLVLSALGDAVHEALDDSVSRPPAVRGAALRQAAEALSAWRFEDRRPVSALLRRPLQRLLTELESFELPSPRVAPAPSRASHAPIPR